VVCIGWQKSFDCFSIFFQDLDIFMKMIENITFRFRTSPNIRKKSILSSASNLNQSFELAGAK
jgi:hypothetical protein